MTIKRLLAVVAGIASIALGAAPGPARAAAELRLWHEMTGAQALALEALAVRFNASQAAWRVVPVHKGDFAVAAALAEQARGSGPHLVQAGDDRVLDLLAREGAVVPLWQVLQGGGLRSAYAPVPALAAPFSDAQGRLVALPVAATTPVLYYNRDAFRRARLDPGPSLRTWYEMANTLGALIDAGERCGYTTAWPSWVLLENMSAWHNEPFSAEGGASARLSFNGQLMVRWIAMLASWQKAGYFTYAGREDEAEARFAAGECVVLTSASSSYEPLRKRAPFDVAVAALPYYDDFSAAPQNTLARGSALWVLAGRPPREYEGVARFVAFLSRADVQAEWHQKTGYVPLSRIAYEITRAQGFYLKNPGHEVAVRQLVIKPPTAVSRGLRSGELPGIRRIIDEELESVWGGKKTPLDALDAAVLRGNALLRAAPR